MSSTGADGVVATTLGRDAVVPATCLNQPIPIIANGHNDCIAAGALVIVIALLTFLRTPGARNHGAGATGGNERQIAGTRQNALAVAAGAEYRGNCVDINNRVVTVWKMSDGRVCVDELARAVQRSIQLSG